ncbi:MAG: iron ABC transporter permease, partial [Halocynthiibacter sp.]
VGLEKTSRRKSRYHNGPRNQRPMQRVCLLGWRGWVATVLCILPFAVGFILPVTVIGAHALANADLWLDPALRNALFNTVWVGSIAALITVVAALFMVYGVRLTGRRLPRILLPVSTIGYAAPGAVLAVGILIPLAKFDNMLADAVLALT